MTIRSRRAIDELLPFAPFTRISEQSRALLSQGTTVKHLSKGAIALHKGQSVSGAYVVVAGRLRVFAVAPNGTEATLYFIDPGEACVLALNSLFNDVLYPAWVQAESTTRMVVIPGAVYRRLFDLEAEIRDLTIRSFSTVVYRLMSELEQVHASGHRERLAQFILLHAASDGTLRMTQQQIADHLGTTREVVARLLSELTRRGLLRTRRGIVAIRDPFALRRVVAPDARLGRQE